MPRFFNTAGPVNPEDHYFLPPLERIDLPQVLTLIEQKKYFVLHAPRQTGKTSVLRALMDHLNASGQYHCVYANAEIAQGMREDLSQSMPALIQEIASKALFLTGNSLPRQITESLFREPWPVPSLAEFLTRWCDASDRPVILLIDEIDALVGDTLITVLRQLRAGYSERPIFFPQSVVLCGVRDVCDYRLHTNGGKAVITGGSAFNIKAESLRLGDFSRSEVGTLYLQHTSETGQRFEPEAIEMTWHLTRGQPWLVNALAYEVCFRMVEGRDRAQAITAELIEQAKENLIVRRETHLDQLTDKLREERVRWIIQKVLVGDEIPINVPEDDLQYVEDLGLIHRKPSVAIANPIYQEVIPRDLTSVTQDTIVQEPVWYMRPDGWLDIGKLLSAFQQFFRENSEAWLERFDYKEAGPHLLLQAFLQRIVNGGGYIGREYGLGRKRTDLLIRWKISGGEQRVVMELKLVHGNVEQVIETGAAQTAAYMDTCGADEGHLILFDRSQKPWAERIFRCETQSQGKAITVWGM